MIKIYTTLTCPKCNILKKKLDEKNIVYEEVTDEEEMQRLGIMSLPFLLADDVLMDFSHAIKYVNER